MAAPLPDILRALEALAGAILVAAVLSDVFRSVVLPRASGRTLRFGPLLGRLLLRVGLWWARRGGRGHARLGALGPLLIVLELIVWIELLVIGYTLLLHASQGLKPSTSFGDALHAAASVFATTGLSGQEASTGPARFVVSFAGFSGLAVVTLVVTFLLSVQTGLMRREALVVRLRARIGSHPSGIHLLETLSRIGPGRDAALPGFFQDWESWAADVLLTHRAYPILVYFRSTDENCGWLAAIGAVLDAAALVCVMEHEDAGEHARVCHRIGTRLVVDLARQLRQDTPRGDDIDHAAFAAALQRLRTAGYCTPEDETAARDRFRVLHHEHAPPLRALTAYLGEQPAHW